MVEGWKWDRKSDATEEEVEGEGGEVAAGWAKLVRSNEATEGKEEDGGLL